MQSAGAEDGPADAPVECGGEIAFGADAAAELHRHAGRIDDLAHDAAVHRLAGLGPIQIDNVNAVGAEFDPAPGDGGRIVGEDGFPRVIALPQPDAPAIEEVDSGVDEHARSLNFIRIVSLRRGEGTCPAR